MPDTEDLPKTFAANAAHLLDRYAAGIVILVGLLVSLPLLLFGLPAASDDGIWHVFYYENFSRQFFDGDLYPRWLNAINGGLGGPTFFFYQPTIYYVTCLFEWLPVGTLHKLGITAAIGIIASGVTVFLWLRELSGVRPALVGTILFLLMPYPVGHDIYVRAALGEALTFVWIPLCLYFLVRICRGERSAIAGFGIAYALLCFSHLPITFIASGVIGLQAIFLSDRRTIARNLTGVFAGAALGVSIAAIYVLPAMMSQGYVYINEMREGQFYFGGWLMDRELKVYGSRRYFWMAAEVGFVAAVSLCVGLVFNRLRRRESVSLGIIASVSIFMMLGISFVVWDWVTPLQPLQFPWRFNTLLSIAAAALIAIAVAAFSALRRIETVLLTAVIVGFAGYWTWEFRNVAADAYRPLPQWKKDFDTKLTRLGLDQHGLWPRTSAPGAYDLDKSLRAIPSVGAERARAFSPSPEVSVTIKRWLPREVELDVVAGRPAIVNVSQFYFPGWRARLVGNDSDLPLTASQDLGLVSLNVPAGHSSIDIRLEQLWPERLGFWLTIAGLACLAYLLFVWRGRSAVSDRVDL